ncbi:MAG: MaoC family dehydratase [Kiloniellales bacterium]|nr:MaoC family dehydratase [Kiloniellales bacterium]
MQELHGYYIEDLSVGMTDVFTKTVTETDIVTFAGISGDTNPIHLNKNYAQRTIFKERIAHGLLSASFISAVLGTRLPGPGCIYLSQSLNFLSAVRIGDTVIARATITGVDPEKRRVSLQTVCSVDDRVAVEGEAMLMVASRPVEVQAAQ